MDLATATEIVRDDMAQTHGPSMDWSDDSVLYDFILGTTSPDHNAYTAYRSHLAEAYTVVYDHVYRHLSAEREATGDPHTLCNSPRCSLGEGHQLPCTDDFTLPC